jgi:hypothetical protein
VIVLPGSFVPFGLGYGGLGLYGLSYYGGFYDPWYGSWDPYYGAYDPFGGSVGYGGGYGYSSSPSQEDDEGGIHLRVKPSDASVYVDGYYVGLVSQFDGTFQKLRIESGQHRIEIRAPGYETLTLDVQIEAHHTSTYRGELHKTQ